MGRDSSAKHRWCITLPNWTVAEEESLKAIACKYLVYGRETCPTTGTPHLQGYIEFVNRKSLAMVKTLIPRAHLLPAKGTAEENRTYCSKEDPLFHEQGEFTSQGKRTDLVQLLADIKQGNDHRTLIDDHPEAFFKYHVAIDKAMTLFAPKRNWVMHVEWIYGPTGTGKSHYANEAAGEDVYRKPPGKWWDGYTGQNTVILDEYRPDWWTFYYLLLLLDKYPLTVEIKGGTRSFSSRVILITAPIRWDKMYQKQDDEKLNQLGRRITTSKYFGVRYATGAIVNEEADDHILEDVNLVPNFNPQHQREWGGENDWEQIEQDIFGM